MMQTTNTTQGDETKPASPLLRRRKAKRPAMTEEFPDTHRVDVTTNGIHRITFARSICLDDLAAALGELNEQIDLHSVDGHRVLVLADVSRLERVSLDARKYGVQWLKQKRFVKLAAICHSLYIKHFVQMLVVACGLSYEMRVFNDADQACEWLAT